jgi:hypothetical protein
MRVGGRSGGGAILFYSAFSGSYTVPRFFEWRGSAAVGRFVVGFIVFRFAAVRFIVE